MEAHEISADSRCDRISDPVCAGQKVERGAVEMKLFRSIKNIFGDANYYDEEGERKRPEEGQICAMSSGK